MTTQVWDVTKWGVDFGNVLVRNISPEGRKELIASYTRDPATLDALLMRHPSLVPNAVPGLKRLVDLRGTNNVAIVSRAKGIERIINRRLFAL